MSAMIRHKLAPSHIANASGCLVGFSQCDQTATVVGEDWALVALAARATGALTFSCDIAYSDSPAPSTGLLSTPIWR